MATKCERKQQTLSRPLQQLEADQKDTEGYVFLELEKNWYHSHPPCTKLCACMRSQYERHFATPDHDNEVLGPIDDIWVVWGRPPFPTDFWGPGGPGRAGPMLRNSASGPEMGLPGRIWAAF